MQDPEAYDTGQLTDDKPDFSKALTFSRPWDPWYYLHVQEKISSTHATDAEFLPIAEYLFRYDRGAFWIGAEAFKYFGFVPFNRLTRWFLDDFMHTRMLFRALHGSNVSSTVVVQDLSLPYSTAEEFIASSARDLAIWPLWLCPLREMSSPTFHPFTTLPGRPGDDAPKPMLNIGLWDRGARSADAFVAQNRALEGTLARLGGRKVLYSHTYYTEKVFWDLYDREWYEDMRKRYDATTLPTVFDKVKVDLTSISRDVSWGKWLTTAWPFAGIAGIRSAIRSKDYLLHRPVCRHTTKLVAQKE